MMFGLFPSKSKVRIDPEIVRRKDRLEALSEKVADRAEYQRNAVREQTNELEKLVADLLNRNDRLKARGHGSSS